MSYHFDLLVIPEQLQSAISCPYIICKEIIDARKIENAVLQDMMSRENNASESCASPDNTVKEKQDFSGLNISFENAVLATLNGYSSETRYGKLPSKILKVFGVNLNYTKTETNNTTARSLISDLRENGIKTGCDVVYSINNILGLKKNIAYANIFILVESLAEIEEALSVIGSLRSRFALRVEIVLSKKISRYELGAIASKYVGKNLTFSHESFFTEDTFCENGSYLAAPYSIIMSPKVGSEELDPYLLEFYLMFAEASNLPLLISTNALNLTLANSRGKHSILIPSHLIKRILAGRESCVPVRSFGFDAEMEEACS